MAAAFIERRLRRVKFDQALIDDEHPVAGASTRVADECASRTNARFD